MSRRRVVRPWLVCCALLPGLAAAVGCGGKVVSDEAKFKLGSGLGQSTLAVYPVTLIQGTERVELRGEIPRIVAGLRTAGFESVTPAGESTGIQPAWRPDQEAVFRQAARQLAIFVAGHPPQADYGLYAQYLMRADDGKVTGVHWMIADRRGQIAAAGMLNEDHPLFQMNSPAGKAGCTSLLLESVKDQMQRHVAEAKGRAIPGRG